MKKSFKFFNDNHWFVIAGLCMAIILFWVFGCESSCKSLLSPEKLVNRIELQAELEYLTQIANARAIELNKQDEIKQQLLDAGNIIGSGGSINTSGLINLFASIGAISFGLNRNQALKNARKNNSSNSNG